MIETIGYQSNNSIKSNQPPGKRKKQSKNLTVEYIGRVKGKRGDVNPFSKEDSVKFNIRRVIPPNQLKPLVQRKFSDDYEKRRPCLEQDKMMSMSMEHIDKDDIHYCVRDSHERKQKATSISHPVQVLTNQFEYPRQPVSYKNPSKIKLFSPESKRVATYSSLYNAKKQYNYNVKTRFKNINKQSKDNIKRKTGAEQEKDQEKDEKMTGKQNYPAALPTGLHHPPSRTVQGDALVDTAPPVIPPIEVQPTTSEISPFRSPDIMPTHSSMQVEVDDHVELIRNSMEFACTTNNSNDEGHRVVAKNSVLANGSLEFSDITHDGRMDYGGTGRNGASTESSSGEQSDSRDGTFVLSDDLSQQATDQKKSNSGKPKDSYLEKKKKKITYKPYKYSEYLSLKATFGRKVGGLGPEVETEKYKAMKERAKRIQDYSSKIRSEHQIRKFPKRQETFPAYSPPSKTALAQNYAKTIPLPKVKPKNGENVAIKSVSNPKLKTHPLLLDDKHFNKKLAVHRRHLRILSDLHKL